MFTKESLIEWATSWVPTESPFGEPGQRERFAASLRAELDARDAEVEDLRAVYEAAKRLRPKLPSTHSGDRWPLEEGDLADAVDAAEKRRLARNGSDKRGVTYG